jgi:hypothetical protein
MLASEAIAFLQTTELKQLKVGEDDATVLGYLNAAVKELHKRFNLWQDEAIITQVDGTTLYKLDGSDANVSIDLSDKNLLVITELFDYLGESMNVNDEDDVAGAVTPKYNWVEFPSDGIVDGEEFSVIFQATPTNMAATTETIDLPPTLEEAMYFYAAFKGHTSQKGDGKFENNTHYKRFIAECDRVQALGLIVPDGMTTHKFGGATYPWP